MSEVSAKLQKTSSLKLPIHSLIYFAINHIRIHQQYTRNLNILKIIDTILTKLFTNVQSGHDKEAYTKFYALNQASYRQNILLRKFK